MEKKKPKESVPSCLAEMIGCSAGGALDRFVPNKQKCTFKYHLTIKQQTHKQCIYAFSILVHKNNFSLSIINIKHTNALLFHSNMNIEHRYNNCKNIKQTNDLLSHTNQMTGTIQHWHWQHCAKIKLVNMFTGQLYAPERKIKQGQLSTILCTANEKCHKSLEAETTSFKGNIIVSLPFSKLDKVDFKI